MRRVEGRGGKSGRIESRGSVNSQRGREEEGRGEGWKYIYIEREWRKWYLVEWKVIRDEKGWVKWR